MSITNTRPGEPAADDHGGIGPPSPEVIARGYEADTYDMKSVISVPLLVLLFFVLAFGTVTIIFSFIAYPKGGVNPNAHPAAAERNKEPLNERLNRLGRGHEVDQARLEPLKLRSGDARAISRPELPVSEGNSPELHPEDLIPTKERYQALYTGGQGGYGLDKTMSLDDEGLKKLFPVQPNGTKPTSSQHVPSASNAGRGAEGSNVVIPGVPHIPTPGAEHAPPPKTKEPKEPKDKGGKQ